MYGTVYFTNGVFPELTALRASVTFNFVRYSRDPTTQFESGWNRNHKQLLEIFFDRSPGRAEAYISHKTTEHKSMGMSPRYLQLPREPLVSGEY